jgi:hypothetical protein
MKTRLAVLAASLILTLSALNATAATLRLDFSGSVSIVPSGVASAFTLGDPVTGSYFIDTNTPDSNADSTIGQYIGAPSSFTYQFGSYLATAAGGGPGDSVGVFDDSASGDRFQTNVVSPKGADVNGYFLTNLTLLLVDSTGSVFSNDSLPAGLDIADFDVAQAQLIFQHATLPSANVFADLNSVSMVPVPPAVWLFGSGLIGLFGLSRRNKA